MSLVMFASCGLNPCSNGIQKYVPEGCWPERYEPVLILVLMEYKNTVNLESSRRLKKLS